MRVLVTGGAGYIGSVVGEELLAAGHEVTVYDDLSTGYRDAVSPRATFIEGDLLDGRRLTNALREGAIEAVVHMAGRIAVGESMTRPELYYRANLGGPCTGTGRPTASAARACATSTRRAPAAVAASGTCPRPTSSRTCWRWR